MDTYGMINGVLLLSTFAFLCLIGQVVNKMAKNVETILDKMDKE